METLIRPARHLAFTAYPKDLWRADPVKQPNDRLNREIRRRTDVVDVFPEGTAIIRVVGSVLAEQYDEWADGRRYFGRGRIPELTESGCRSRVIAQPRSEV